MTKNKGGRPLLTEEPTKTYGLKLTEAELETIDKLCDQYKIKTKAPMMRLLFGLGVECLQDEYFVNYCMLYQFTPAELFAHIFNTWREHLHKYAPPIRTEGHRFEDICKLFE